MKRRIARFRTLVAAAIFTLSTSVGALASLTTINDSPDRYDEPNLIGVNPFPNNPNPSILETLYGENNLSRVDDSIDIAFQHTGDTAIVKAVARFNNPTIAESLRYFNTSIGILRTVLRFQRVPPSFQFPVGYNPPTELSGLIPLTDSGQVFELRLSGWSNPARNFMQQDMLVTFQIVGNSGHPNNQIGSYVLGWEYFSQDDQDYQDVVFEISGVVPVPEPSCWLLATFALSCVAHRRRR